MQKVKFLFLLLFCGCFPLLVFPQTIVLKSGKTVQGKIVDKTDRYIKLDIGGVILTYYLEDIATIDEAGVSLSQTDKQTVSLSGKDPKEIFNQLSPAVVSISVKTATGEKILAGGFIADKEGIVVTSHHVIADVEEQEKISIRLKDGRVFPFFGKTIQINLMLDFVVFKIDAENLPSLSMGDSDAFQAGETIYVIGSPYGLEQSFSNGMLSGIRNSNGSKYLQFTAPVSPGSSGSPLINSRGEAIGIVTSTIEPAQNLNFALAINEIKPTITMVKKIGALKFLYLDRDDIDYAPPCDDSEQNIAEYSKAIELKPDNVQAYLNRGIAYCCESLYEKALADFNKAIELSPADPKAYHYRSGAEKDFNKAQLDLNKAIELDPKFIEPRFTLARLYSEQKDFDREIAEYSKVIEINPAYASVYYNRGCAYLDKGSFLQAINDFNKVLTLDSKHKRVYNNLAAAYYKQGNYKEAWEYLKRAQTSGCTVMDDLLAELKKVSP
jgi:pentatricopeptide repeat protein